MPLSDDYYRRQLLQAWVHAVLTHAIERIQPERRPIFIQAQLGLLAEDFRVTFIWYGEEIVDIEYL
jgi:hypothetical protein